MTTMSISDRNLRLAILVAFIFSLAYIYPVISADRFYIDDMGRSLDGYLGWGQDGRPLTDMIMTYLSFGFPIVDLSPLNQIFAVIAMSGTVVLYISKYTENVKPLTLGLASSLFIIQPFLLENLSYKFDSLPMALSAILLAIPFFLSRRMVITFIISIICITSSLALYQASIGIFIILSIANVVFSTRNKTIDDIKDTASRALQLIIGYSIYSLIVVKYFVTGTYASVHASMITESTDVIQTLLTNSGRIFGYFSQAIEPYNYFFISVFLMAIVFSIFKEVGLQLRAHGYTNYFKIAVTIASPFIVFLFSFLHLLILENPVFSARVFISLSGTMLFFGVLFLRNLGRMLSVVLISVLLFAGLINAYAYGNAVKAQKKIDDLISASIYQDVNSNGKVFSSVSVYGTMPIARQRTNLEHRFPALARMVPVYLNGDWPWGAKLLQLNLLRVSPSPLGEASKKALCADKPFVAKMDYKLYAVDSTLLISFIDSPCK